MFRGGIWPVAQRELRAGARRPFFNWLRMAGALGAFSVLALLVMRANLFATPDAMGIQLIQGVHAIMLVLMAGVVPALTADCIASERREGTLGLLFLTELTASEIVVGKVMAQMLKAATLWLAMIPIVIISFVGGGIGWAAVETHLMIEVTVGLAALAAGLVATSLVESRTSAFVIAFLLTAGLMALLAGVSGGFEFPLNRLNPGNFWFWARSHLVYGGALYGSPPFAGRIISLPMMRPFPMTASFSRVSSLHVAAGLILAVLLLFLAIRISGRCIERFWQIKTPSIRGQRLIWHYSRPVWKEWVVRQRQRSLERNPIGWLQLYSWQARVMRLGFVLGFILVLCVISDTDNSEFQIMRLVEFSSLVLAVAYTYAGVNSFLEEKKSGALELILVTPLTVNQIIEGRVRGLWKQFLLPALAIAFIYAPWMFRMVRFQPWDNFWDQNFAAVALAAFFALPVFATCFALRCKSVILASALTWLALFCAPLLGMLVCTPTIGTFIFTPMLAYWAGSATARGLEERKYALKTN